MKREIHTIFDIILKMIIVTYSNEFLKLIGEKRSIKRLLKTNITTNNGRQLHLDFLCELEDGTILNVEFQFRGPYGYDLDRFFDYNILSQAEYDKICETIIISFKTSKSGQKTRKMGFSKTIHPKFFYLGDLDFVKILNTIENKVENNLKLTNMDKILLLLMCLVPKCKNKQEILEKICEMIKKPKLFDLLKIGTFKAIIGLEIKNLVSKDKQDKLLGELNMTPSEEKILSQAISKAAEKSIQLQEEEIFKEGIEEGKKEGKKEIAKKLKDILTPEEIHKITGLTMTTIMKL
ncbi:MAG: hypothetical protein IJ287_07520 [Methanobrevibacter sp.]|nr:hypothetical protein [Methanobrevibacter sp.]